MYGTYSVGTWSFHLVVLFQLLIQLLQVQFRYRLTIPKQPEQDWLYIWKQDIRAKLDVANHVPALSSHNSVAVNSVGVNTKNRKNKQECLRDACKTNFYATVYHIDWYISRRKWESCVNKLSAPQNWGTKFKFLAITLNGYNLNNKHPRTRPQTRPLYTPKPSWGGAKHMTSSEILKCSNQAENCYGDSTRHVH